MEPSRYAAMWTKPRPEVPLPSCDPWWVSSQLSCGNTVLAAVTRAHERLTADSLARRLATTRVDLTRALVAAGLPAPFQRFETPVAGISRPRPKRYVHVAGVVCHHAPASRDECPRSEGR